MARAFIPVFVSTAVLAAAGACGGPQVPSVVAPAPCRVDEHGAIVADGGVEAMCCPKDYIAGGNSETNCPKGGCCPLANEVNGRGPAPPYGPPTP